MSEHPIRSNPQILGGKPCFAGTRVPVRNLFDYFEAGRSIEEFLEDFPTVNRQQVLAVLELASDKVLATAQA